MRNQKITKFEKTKKFTTYKIIIRLKFGREGARRLYLLHLRDESRVLYSPANQLRLFWKVISN